MKFTFITKSDPYNVNVYKIHFNNSSKPTKKKFFSHLKMKCLKLHRLYKGRRRNISVFNCITCCTHLKIRLLVHIGLCKKTKQKTTTKTSVFYHLSHVLLLFYKSNVPALQVRYTMMRYNSMKINCLDFAHNYKRLWVKW